MLEFGLHSLGFRGVGFLEVHPATRSRESHQAPDRLKSAQPTDPRVLWRFSWVKA